MTAGKLESTGGRWQLRFTRELAHPQEKVWRAITEPEHMRACLLYTSPSPRD